MPAELVAIRPRFWPRFLRWGGGCQLVLGLLVGPVVVIRGLNETPLIEPAESVVLGTFFILLGLIALGMAVRRRNLGRADISARGIRPYRLYGTDMLYRWAEIATVRVRQGPLGNRWLEVVPAGEPPFPVTAYPTDPTGVLEALEEFAGPDHPLTRALYAVMGDDRS